MFAKKSGGYFHWTPKGLARLTVPDLVALAIGRRSTQKSFKQVVVDYLVEIGPRVS